MIPDKVREILKHEGVVAIATQGDKGPHLVNTWHSYVQITERESLLVPVGGMKNTEENVRRNNRVLVTIGSREVQGLRGPGTGFLIKGTATMTGSGPQFDQIKKRFAWARAVLEIAVESAEQTL